MQKLKYFFSFFLLGVTSGMLSILNWVKTYYSCPIMPFSIIVEKYSILNAHYPFINGESAEFVFQNNVL